jgi:hypothetical protein
MYATNCTGCKELIPVIFFKESQMFYGAILLREQRSGLKIS